MLIAWLAVLVTGCASQKVPEIKQAPFLDEKLILPPAFSQPANPAAPVSSTPPANPMPPASSAAGVKQLGEISSSTPGATVPSRPCKLDNCGVIVAITHQRGAEKLPPGQALGPADGSGLYSGGLFGEEVVVTKITELWEIRVKMHTGKIHVIQQDYQPFLQVGDPVLVDGNNLQLWN
ncbi:MAG: hypothetical protein ACREVR_07950 [Burkholderiales bacterium]